MKKESVRIAATFVAAVCIAGCGSQQVREEPEVETDVVRPVDDWRAVPHLRGTGRKAYWDFLEHTIRPRAFALSIRGDWAWNTGPNAAEKAIAACEKRGMRCLLYAVDDEVVFPGLEFGILDKPLEEEE